jgi:hypothetical protein
LEIIMDISVHIKPEAVAGLREGRSLDGGETQRLLKFANEVGVSLRPEVVLPSTPVDATLYHIDNVDPSKAEEVVKKLRTFDSVVDTAFLVPTTELP